MSVPDEFLVEFFEHFRSLLLPHLLVLYTEAVDHRPLGTRSRVRHSSSAPSTLQAKPPRTVTPQGYGLQVTDPSQTKPELWIELPRPPSQARNQDRSVQPVANDLNSSPDERPQHHRDPRLESRRQLGPINQSQPGPIQVQVPGRGISRRHPHSTRKKGVGGGSGKSKPPPAPQQTPAWRTGPEAASQ
ncbi:hypothetical protein NDU88_005093 [Pleurodeles waltl]|uniref:Uncharacterized protein n=1 Tax=Pleurodeles waltl TaxID=8319 RepID=A0AAV7SKQ2_PLEWA|nr:hypothetical protein NDU88_005093 [Pleurodeles waltl]